MSGMRAPSRRAALAAAIAAVCVGRLFAAPSKGDEIMAAAVTYVSDFVRRFSTIVAEERFIQNARAASAALDHRGSPNGGIGHQPYDWQAEGA